MKISLENIKSAIVRDEMRAISGGCGGSGPTINNPNQLGSMSSGSQFSGNAGSFGSSSGSNSGSYSYYPLINPSSTNELVYFAQAVGNLGIIAANAVIWVGNNAPATPVSGISGVHP
jgi:hypothetical protein